MLQVQPPKPEEPALMHGRDLLPLGTGGHDSLQGAAALGTGLPPMLSSTREQDAAPQHPMTSGAGGGAGLSGRMPSLQSIKVGSIAHTDPASLLDRVRSASQSGMPAVGSTAFADPAALLARARGEAGMGGLGHRTTLGGISSLPFQSGSLLRFDQQARGGAASSASSSAPRPGVAAPEQAQGTGCVGRAGGASDAEDRPALGRSALPLIEQHTQMRLQQQQRQPQGLHLPISGLGAISAAELPRPIVGREESGPVLRPDQANAAEGAGEAAAGATTADEHMAEADDGGLPAHLGQSADASRHELAAASQGAEVDGNLPSDHSQWAHFWEWTSEELNAGLGIGTEPGEARRRDGDEAMTDAGVLAKSGDQLTLQRSGRAAGGRGRGTASAGRGGRGGRKAGDGARGRACGGAGRTVRAPAKSTATHAESDGPAQAARAGDAEACAVGARAALLPPQPHESPHATATQSSFNGQPSEPLTSAPLAHTSPPPCGEAGAAGAGVGAQGQAPGNGSGNASIWNGMGAWLQSGPGAGAAKGSVPVWTGPAANMLLGTGVPHWMFYGMLPGSPSQCMFPGSASEYLMHAPDTPSPPPALAPATLPLPFPCLRMCATQSVPSPGAGREGREARPAASVV